MVLGLLLLGSATGATAFVVHRMATVGPQPDGAILVPNGQALTAAGAHINLPNLVLILLYDDHTEGTDPAFPTPRAMVADNDLALGRIVEAISKSRFWKESAIFVTEDDSQDGLDHVDGHRTVGFVISPYARHGVVDSHFYTIINLYRTVEQILGLSPLNQFDLAAEPMFTSFTGRPDFTPYTARPNNIPLNEMNPKLAGLKGLQRELASLSLLELAGF